MRLRDPVRRRPSPYLSHRCFHRCFSISAIGHVEPPHYLGWNTPRLLPLLSLTSCVPLMTQVLAPRSPPKPRKRVAGRGTQPSPLRVHVYLRLAVSFKFPCGPWYDSSHLVLSRWLNRETTPGAFRL